MYQPGLQKKPAYINRFSARGQYPSRRKKTELSMTGGRQGCPGTIPPVEADLLRIKPPMSFVSAPDPALENQEDVFDVQIAHEEKDL